MSVVKESIIVPLTLSPELLGLRSNLSVSRDEEGVRLISRSIESGTGSNGVHVNDRVCQDIYDAQEPLTGLFKVSLIENLHYYDTILRDNPRDTE